MFIFTKKVENNPYFRFKEMDRKETGGAS